MNLEHTHTQNIKLAVLSMDEIGNYYQTALINSINIQRLMLIEHYMQLN